MKISIIIPTYNEQEYIGSTIKELKKRAVESTKLQIIVSDGGSQDKTIKKAKKAGAQVIHSTQKRRSVQLNEGAAAAVHPVLYFLHADTIPPRHFDKHIFKSMEQGCSAGCFRLSFKHPHFLLRFYASWTWLDIDAFRYGDQSLFIPKTIFKEIGGYRNDYYHMEDYEIVKRIKKSGQTFNILSPEVTTSARKYLSNGIVRLQAIFVLIFVLHKAGVKQPTLNALYQKLIH